MQTNTIRSALAIIVLLAVITAAGFAFFVGDKLSTIQLTLLTVLLTSLVGEMKVAFLFFFDGTPKSAATEAPAPPAPVFAKFPEPIAMPQTPATPGVVPSHQPAA